MTERALAMRETDDFPFVLARDLHLTLAELEDMPHDEYVKWRAFYRYERWVNEPKKSVRG